MHFVTKEFSRRCTEGNPQPLSAVRDEAKALLIWFQSKYSTLPSPSPFTIENKIRDQHRAWRKLGVETGNL
jgi:hypothetical protein